MLPLFYKADADNRKHQINTLKIFNDNVTEIAKDSDYEVLFQAGDNSFVLKISLGSDFPSKKPRLVVSPPIVHAWANESGTITSAPGLLNFTVHSDLGRVVQAIIREFQRNPPPLAGNNVVSPPIPISNGENRTSPSFSSNYSFSPPSHMPVLNSTKSTLMYPQQSLGFPEIHQLSLDDLRFIYENEDRQVELINDLPNMTEQNRVMDDLILQIEDTAEENMKKHEELEYLKGNVESRIEKVTKLAFDNERLYSAYQNLSEKYSPRNIQEELGLAAKKAEQESEKIAESFLQGDLDVDKFLNLFTKSKALCQLRKTKEEKLCHQLDRLEKAGF